MSRQSQSGTQQPLELQQLEKLLKESMAAPLEEAVPANMMEVFSDEQWPQLLFEFQPSLRILAAHWDVVSYRQEIEAGRVPVALPPGQLRHWLIFRNDMEQLVRPLDALEHRALTCAIAGSNFAALADLMWPGLEVQQRQHRMTSLLLNWISEGLIIDAGVPLPDDAEYAE